jgi:hypothetical protein
MEWESEILIFNGMWAIQLYHGENKLYLVSLLIFILILVLPGYSKIENKCLLVDIS